MSSARGFTSAEDFAQNVGYNKKTILYVGGLSEEVTEETLHGAFIPFGEIVQVAIPRDPGDVKHRGFGFVEYEDPEDAKHAMENMQDAEFFGRVVKCNIAKPNALKAKAVWDEADKWYEKTLQKDSHAVESEMRRATEGNLQAKDLESKKRDSETAEAGRPAKKAKKGHPEVAPKKKMSLSSTQIWGKYFFKVL
eukprot:gb/GEZN01009898.1/.p1 GENE.gb/GEZN01009898.1/~~gb/GEZN01009898.1/.p1  ORF type:complete len:194 (-),score=41.19 gb/GEZN01009898.1/:684-1265(-)